MLLLTLLSYNCGGTSHQRPSSLIKTDYFSRRRSSQQRMHERTQAQGMLQMLVNHSLLKSKDLYSEQVAAKVTLLANALRLAVLLVAAPAAAGVAWAVALAAVTLAVAATVVAVTESAIVAAAVVILLGNVSHDFLMYCRPNTSQRLHIWWWRWWRRWLRRRLWSWRRWWRRWWRRANLLCKFWRGCL